MNKKKAIKIATASAIAATGFVAVAPAQAAVKTTNVNTVVNTAISKMAAAYDGYHKPGLQGKIPPTAKIRQLTTNAEAAYDAAVAAIAKDGGTKSQKAAFTKKLNAKKYLLTRAQGYVKAIDVNLNAAKKALDKAVASGKAKDVKAAEAALQKTAATFEKAVKAVYGPSTRKVLVAKYHVPALEKAATVKDELTVYNAYKEIESGNLIEKNLERAGSIIEATKATVDKLAKGDKRDTKLVKNLLDAVAKNDAKYYEKGNIGVVKSIMAINATTVEVTYKDAVENVDALKYSIEGLTIASAVVKQTDDKTVILTTSAQEGAKEYTVKSGAIKVGTFKGVSAVIPTAIKVTTPSIQGTIGKEVTVKATVTVPEGQSKAGIPVTINVPAGNSLNGALTKEVYTDANGEASYSYTRFSAVNDNVVVYPTGNRTVSATASVYWANSLSITEVTAGNALPNGAKKVYKIKTNSYSTQYVGNSTTVDYNYVNVAFVENVNVSPDKLVRGVNVIDTGISTNASYPSQVTTGGVNEVRVKVDANGEASFTLTGASSSVTPVVFVDGNKNAKWEASELQASAPTVKFDLAHTLGLTVKAEGVQNAAASSTKGDGGRDYTVTITDKDGKAAPAGTKAYVTFAEGSYSAGVSIGNTSANKGTRYELTADAKGQATFTLTGTRDSYAAPTVYLENGKEFGLDKADLQSVGESTYFVDAVVNNADLTVKNAEGKTITSLPTTQSAFFHYESVDQNGFEYYSGTGSYEVSYEVTANFADVTVYGIFGSKTVKKGTTETVKVQASAGKAALEVKSENVASNVTVNASASLVSLPNKTASVSFTNGSQLPAVYTGVVSTINTTGNTLTFAGYDAIKYSTASFKNEQGVVVDETKFEALVNDALTAKNKVEVTAVRNADGTYTLEIAKITTVTPGTPGTGTIKTAELSADETKLTVTFDKDLVASSVDLGDFKFSTGTTASAVASVSEKKVVLNVTGVTATSTVTVDADEITFTDGTSNAAITAKLIDTTKVSKISTLDITKPNQKAVDQVDATGSVVVGAKTFKAAVKTAELKQAAYNGLKVTFVQDGTSSANPTATYNGTTRVITVKLGLADANNTLTKINTAIAGATPATHGDVKMNNVVLATTSAVPTFEEVATPVTLTLAGGVNAVTPAQAGVYTFTISTNLVVGDVVKLNGKSYVAGTDFVVASTTATTAKNLADAIKTKDARFASATNTAAVITLTDAVINDADAPTLSFN